MKKATSILLICGMITGGMMLSGCSKKTNFGIDAKAEKAIIKYANAEQIVKITDWKYGENGMIKLYLTNGGEVVTHSSNVFIVNGELE